MEDDSNFVKSEPTSEQIISQKVVGRTWVDLVFSSGYVLVGLVVIGVIVYLSYRIYGVIPTWIWIALGGSLLFIPFLIERAKGDSQLILINDNSQSLTEYRVGSRYPILVEDAGLDMYSHTGRRRMVYTNIEHTENGVLLGGETLTAMSTFEFLRDMNILRRITTEFSHYLKQDRMTNELIGLEVERKVSEYSETWLRMLYGSLDPSDIEELISQNLTESHDDLDIDAKFVKEYGGFELDD